MPSKVRLLPVAGVISALVLLLGACSPAIDDEDLTSTVEARVATALALQPTATPQTIAIPQSMAIPWSRGSSHCRDDGPLDPPPTQRNDQMSVEAHSLTLTDEIYYLADEVSYVVRQPEPERTIAVVEITARNHRNTHVREGLGPDSFRLLDEDLNQHHPIDPFDTEAGFVRLAPDPPAAQPYYYCNPAPPREVTFMWGLFDLPGREIGARGLALFDVPRGLEYSQLRWLAVEPVFVWFDGAFDGASEHLGR